MAATSLIDEAERRVPPDLTVEELVAYREGSMSEAAAERIRDRLAVDPEAASMLLELAAFPEAAGGEAPEPGEVAADWTRVKGRLAREGAFDVRPAPVWRSKPAMRIAYALAAVFLVATVGLAIQLASLRRQVAELSRPKGDVVISDLLPLEEARTRGAGTRIELPGWAADLVLNLNLAASLPYDSFRVDVSDAAGEVVWSHGRLHRSLQGTVTVAFPRGSLLPGEYQLRLLGQVAGGEAQEVATYRVSVDEPQESQP